MIVFSGVGQNTACTSRNRLLERDQMGNVIGYYKVFTTDEALVAVDDESWPNAAKHAAVTQWVFPYADGAAETARECATAKALEVSSRLGGVPVYHPVRIKGMSAYAIRVGLERIEA